MEDGGKEVGNAGEESIVAEDDFRMMARPRDEASGYGIGGRLSFPVAWFSSAAVWARAMN